MQAFFLKYIPWKTENRLEVTRSWGGGIGVTDFIEFPFSVREKFWK